MDINLNDYPPFSTVTVADPKRPPDGVKHINVQDYDAARDGEVITVLTPADRAALVQ